MMYLIIYLVGYVFNYYSLRKMKRKQVEKDYTWEHVVVALMLSFTSWVGVIIFYFIKFMDHLKNTKPPKWL